MRPEIRYENGVWMADMPEGDRVFSSDKTGLERYLDECCHPRSERQAERIATAAMIVGVCTLAMVVTAALALFGKWLGEQ